MNYTEISDAAMIKLKLVFLSSWIEMVATLKVNQYLHRRSFVFDCAGNSFEIHCFDYEGSPAKPMSFEEYVGINIALFASKNGFQVL